MSSSPAPPVVEDAAARAYRFWATFFMIAYLGVCLGFSYSPIRHTFTNPNGNKDYSRWYDAGQHVLHGQSLYDADATHDAFDFLYPPFAAVGLFALPSVFGPTFLVAFLILLASGAWIGSAFISLWLYTGEWVHKELLLYFLAIASTIAFGWDIYLLGQPNLILLGLLMVGFWGLRKNLGWVAGLMLALATAIKAFPIVLIGYFVWRKQWSAAGWTIAFLSILLVGVPGVVRGFDRNQKELTQWLDAMIFKQSDTNIAQRPDLAFQWRNQSLVSVVHRLTRHVIAIPDENSELYMPKKAESAEGAVDTKADPARFVNLIDVGPAGSKRIYLGLMALLGLGFAWVSFGEKNRSIRSDAAEYALALGLVLMATPKAGSYYYIWLLFPLTVAFAFIYESPAGSARRLKAMVALGLSLAILASAAVQTFNPITQAYGATALGGLGVWLTVLWMCAMLRNDGKLAGSALAGSASDGMRENGTSVPVFGRPSTAEVNTNQRENSGFPGALRSRWLAMVVWG